MTFSFCIFYCILLVRITDGVKHEGNDKRILANDPSYLHQIEVKLQDLAAKVNENTNNQKEYAAAQNRSMQAKDAVIDMLLKKQTELEAIIAAQNKSLQSQFNKFKSTTNLDVGSVYTRWGRTVCPSTADLVYTGYVGGSWYLDKGAAANYLCLTKIPQWWPHATNTSSAYVYGGEYEYDFHSATSLDDHSPACSVCRTNRSSILMMPAKTECLDEWTLEYTGYLSAGSRYFSATEYVCLDRYPERLTDIGNGHNGVLFYAVGSKCGNLPCPPYVDQGELSCVVCSK